jgi:hypothetical protein
MATTYSTTAAVKAWLVITSAADDAKIDQARGSAKAVIDGITGIIWVAANGGKSFHAVEDVIGRDLRVPYFTALTTVTNGDNEVLTTADYVTVGDPKYIIRLKQLSGKWWSWSSKDDPTDAIVIVADWGYQATTAPELIIQLEMELAAWFYENRNNKVAGQFLIATQQGTIQLPAGYPKSIVDQLYAERRVL